MSDSPVHAAPGLPEIRDGSENGLRCPIDQDDQGNTLDGHQRERALMDLGISKYPINVISGLTEQQIWNYAVSVNGACLHNN